MNTRSTQRVVGLVVALVATALLLMALPSKPGPQVEPGTEAARASASADGTEAGPVDPRDVLPVFEERDGWWVLTRYGFRMRLPEGWTPLARRDRPFAYLDPEATGMGNLNVLSLPNFFHSDLASVAEENRASLAENEHLDLISIEEIELSGSGEPALLIDYAGTPSGYDMHFTTAVFMLGGHQVIITAAADATEWDSVSEALDRSLRSIELLDLPTMDYDEQMADVPLAE